MKKILIGVITAGMLLIGATGVLAATFKSPAEIYAELKGGTVEEAYAAKATGKSFGRLADEAGVLDEFKAKMLENRKTVIQERVANGQLTQEQADFIIKNMETNQANCEGTGMLGRSGTGKMGGMGQGMKGALGAGRGMAGGGCWRIQGTGNTN
jgi:hypothetical protein